MHVRRAQLFRAIGRDEDAREAFADAIEVSAPCWQDGRPSALASASELRSHALLFETRHAFFQDDDDMRQAATILETVHQRDPYNLPVILRLHQISLDLGNATTAKRWGEEALRVDDLKRLEASIKGLSREQRSAIERYLKPA